MLLLLLLVARRKQGTTTSDRRGASQSAATLCSAILSTHSPPRAAEAVTCLRSQDGSRAVHVDAACCHPIHAICAVLLADLVPACDSLQAAAACSKDGPPQATPKLSPLDSTPLSCFIRRLVNQDPLAAKANMISFCNLECIRQRGSCLLSLFR